MPGREADVRFCDQSENVSRLASQLPVLIKDANPLARRADGGCFRTRKARPVVSCS